MGLQLFLLLDRASSFTIAKCIDLPPSTGGKLIYLRPAGGSPWEQGPRVRDLGRDPELSAGEETKQGGPVD